MLQIRNDKPDLAVAQMVRRRNPSRFTSAARDVFGDDLRDKQVARQSLIGGQIITSAAICLVMPIPVVAVMRIVGIQVSVGPVAIAVGTTSIPATTPTAAISAAGRPVIGRPSRDRSALSPAKFHPRATRLQ